MDDKILRSATRRDTEDGQESTMSAAEQRLRSEKARKVMYKKELRSPMWQEIPKSERKIRNETQSNFKKSYQPSGAQVQNKTFTD